jgi:hypothetical protein
MTLLTKNIDVSKISVSKPNVLDNGAKLIYVNYENEKKFKIQTPKMVLPFGLNEYSEGPYPKYSVELSFRENQSTDPKEIKNNEKVRQFHDKLLEIENRLLELAIENGTSWFKMPKNKINHDVIASKFLPPIVKVSKDKDGEPDGKYPPTMKCKIYCKDDKWGVKLFEMSDPSKTINVNDTDVDSPDIKNVLAGGARIKGIISCVGIWIGSGTFMCQWALSEAQVDVPEGSSSQSQSFVPDSDDEDADETIVEATSGAPTEVQDSDDGDSDGADGAEDSDAPPPEPAPTPKKTTKKLRVKKN